MVPPQLNSLGLCESRVDIEPQFEALHPTRRFLLNVPWSQFAVSAVPPWHIAPGSVSWYAEKLWTPRARKQKLWTPAHILCLGLANLRKHTVFDVPRTSKNRFFDQVRRPPGAARPSTSVFVPRGERPVLPPDPGGCQRMRADSRRVLPSRKVLVAGGAPPRHPWHPWHRGRYTPIIKLKMRGVCLRPQSGSIWEPLREAMRSRE